MNNSLSTKVLSLSCFIALLLPSFAKAQDSKKKYDEAIAFINNNVYDQALPLLISLSTEDPANNNLNFQVGQCYVYAPVHQEKGIPYLVRASADVSDKYNPSFKEKHAPNDAYLFLGKAYHLNCQFDSAIICFSKFLSLIDTTRDKQTLKDVEREIYMCNNGKQLMAHPVKMYVKNLGDSINSPGPDYSAVVSADESQIFFTSRREGALDPTTGKYYENIYMADNVNGIWKKAKNIGPPINEKGKHSATVGLSPDGQTIFIYRDDGNGDGNIYTTHLNGLVWGIPQKLNDNVDSKYWEPSASISADGQTLYFSSNRPGGYGGLDIYISRLLPNGQWGKAINLGPTINTQYDEDAPYIHPSGNTLYFSSKGHNTMGGFDIFSSALDSNGHWGTPENIGYPVNTPGDDIFYFPTTDGKSAYYSSFKDNGLGEKDIYRITLPERRGEALTVFRGRIIPSGDSALPDGLEIVVTDNQTSEQIGIYHPNIATGKYLIILPCGKNYNVVYNLNDNPFHKENLDVRDSTSYSVIERAVELRPLIVGAKATLNGIFFASSKSDLSPEAKAELQKLAELMKNHPDMKVEIGGYSDGSEDPAVAQARADAAMKYLESQGISADRLIAKSYGSSKPIARDKNDDGSWNKDGMKLNRRIGFKVISSNEDVAIDQPINVPDDLKPGAQVAQKTSVKGIFFASGKSALTADAKTELNKVYEMLKKHPNAKIEIGGYSDGSEDPAVAQARADAAMKYLISRGIDKSRLTAKGYGSSMPIAKDKNADGSWNKDGMKLNRRIGFKVTSGSDEVAIDQPINVPSNLMPNANQVAQNSNQDNTIGQGTGSSAGYENILFETGKHIIRGKYLPELKKLCELMKSDKNVTVTINGHTDTQGNDKINQPLSEARAASAALYLTKRGIDPSRIKTKGYGSTMPLTKNTNADGSPNKEGMALNRRAEIKVNH
jgi:outer membrane protein OmpA-like peptidoglycan-associated protein